MTGRRALLATTALVVVLHALLLAAFSLLLHPPSLLKDVAPPFYTRTITPEAPAVVAVAPPPPVAAPTQRPTARIHTAHNAPKKRAIKPASARDADGATRAPEPAASAAIDLATGAPFTEPPDAPTETSASVPADAPIPAASSPTAPASTATAATPAAPPASAADLAFLAQWPKDTRLTYKLGGNYRGELHGDARVLWQRQGTRYHTAVEMSAGLLASLSFTSQGDITALGLRPEVYEENVRGRRRGVRLAEDVRLNNGTRVARPDAVQDTASQFVELGHRFVTGRAKLEPGAQIDFSMARPGGIDDWTYDVIGAETLHLPRLGPVLTYHLKPRPLSKPRGPISAEIWYAPSLQYLPVRIRITQGSDAYIELLVDTIEQQ